MSDIFSPSTLQERASGGEVALQDIRTGEVHPRARLTVINCTREVEKLMGNGL